MRKEINEAIAMASFGVSAFSAVIGLWGCPHVGWLRFIPITLLGVGIGFSFVALWQSRWFPRGQFREIANQEFINTDVALNGYRYLNCIFTNVNFLYGGHDCGGFDSHCRFKDIGFVAIDPKVGQMLALLMELHLLRENAKVLYRPRKK